MRTDHNHGNDKVDILISSTVESNHGHEADKHCQCKKKVHGFIGGNNLTKATCIRAGDHLEDVSFAQTFIQNKIQRKKKVHQRQQIE